MKDLYIIGAGGFGREVAWLVERINTVNPTWNLKGFIDDNEAMWDTNVGTYSVLGDCKYLMSLGDVYAVCAIGVAKIKKRVIEKLSESSVKFATLIDPSVIMSSQVNIGEGTIILAGTVITVDSKIGNYVTVDLNCTLGHDVNIENYVTLNPSVNVSSRVLINESSEIGTGSQIYKGRIVAPETIISAGSVVFNDCLESGTYAGNPAKIIKGNL